jgi:hypothetical protein
MAIPFISIADKPIVSTTQKFIPLADIVDGILLFKNGAAALVMESSSLNFGLLSAREQQAVIASYAALQNSITFPIQIVVRSLRKDISNYIKSLEAAQVSIDNPKLHEIMEGYKNFISDAIKKKNVLSKKFYIVLPFTQYELGITKSMAQSFKPGRGDKPLAYPKSYVIRKAKITLYPKRDHIMRQMGRLGIQLTQLDTEALIDLSYSVYNPLPPIKERSIFGSNEEIVNDKA